MEESLLRGKTPYYGSVEFKKVFDIVPRSDRWKIMTSITCLSTRALPKLAWRQLKGRKKDIIGEVTNFEEIEQYVSKLYMHDTIMPITLSIETPYKAWARHVCLVKILKMAKVEAATLMASELLK